MATLRHLIRCSRGATAVEFALILPALLLFIVGSIEAAIILFIGSSIESAVLDASRYGITGTEEEGVSRADRVLQIVEARTYGLLDPDTIELDTLVYDSFEDIGKPEPLTNDANGNGAWDDGDAYVDVNGNGQWDADMGEAGLGGSGAVVVYRLTYAWGVVTPILQRVLGGTVTHVSSIALKNEPF